jgi:hypothetical protein
MTDPETNELPVVEPQAPRCRHLRNKGMYVYSDGQGREAHEDYDNTIYWCLKTLKEYGPDDDNVGGADCHNPERSCYEPF